MITRIGIMGCGWITENAHIPSLLKIHDVKIVAVYDIDISRAIRLCEEFNIEHAFENIEEFISVGIDAAVIATPNFTHAEYTMKLIDHGIHVLCEKPVALTEKEIFDVCNHLEKRNVIYVPAFVNRWRQDIQMINTEIDSGKIGKITEIQAGWIRKNGVPRPGTWFTKQSLSGGGVLIDLGSHILDICLMFMRDRKIVSQNLKASLCNIEKLQNKGFANWFEQDYEKNYQIDVEDNIEANVLFDDNAQMNVKLSWMSETDADYTYFKIIGEKKQIELKTLFGFSNERLWKEDWLIFEVNGVEEIVQLDKKENNSRKAFDRMHEYFIKSIQNQETCFTNGKDAIKTVKLIDNLYQSMVIDC